MLIIIVVIGQLTVSILSSLCRAANQREGKPGFPYHTHGRKPGGNLAETWRKPGGNLAGHAGETWRKPGGNLAETWRKPGGNLMDMHISKSTPLAYFLFGYLDKKLKALGCAIKTT